MAEDTLAAVRRATRARERAQQELRDAIKEAHVHGHSLREIARLVGVTHTRILQIVNDHPTNPDPAYSRAHRRVDKLRGKPKQCSRCATTDPDKIYEWANLTGNYEDVDDYARMCRSCHRKYDKARVQQILRGE